MITPLPRPNSAARSLRALALAVPFLALLGLGSDAGAAPADGVESIGAAAWPAPVPLVERSVGPHVSGLLRSARRFGAGAAVADAARRGIDRADDGTFDVLIVRSDGPTRRLAVTLESIPFLLADDDVRTIRLPVPVSITRLTEGVALTAADVAHVGGATGAGCRLAIVDAGFKGLSALVTAGGIAAPVATKNFTSSGLEKTTAHGTAVAEIAHQMAPDAELLLVKIANISDFKDALAWVANKNADVVNLSIGFPGLNFSDGTGAAAKAVKKVRKKGVLPVVSAGNNGDSHWLGGWNDPDQDKFLDFAAGDEGLTVEAAQGSSVSIHLVWDDFPTTKVDLDLAVYWVGTAQNPIPPSLANLQDFSAVTQNGSQPPLEIVSFQAPQTGRYAAFVNRGKKKPSRVALFSSHEVVDGNNVEESSLLTPGDAKASLTVGALGVSQWSSGPVQAFSSRGPNLKGAPKPTLVGPDGTTSATAGYDPFFGTSAAAPHVAGAACLLKSVNSALGPDGIEARLVAGAVVVPGATVDEAGAGRLDLGFDFTPPTPDPATIDPSSVVTAETATVVATASADATPPLEFRFEYLGKAKHGGDDRDWAASSSHLDDGLKPDRSYKYRAQVRDAAPVPNETAWSAVVTLRTLARTPGAPSAKSVAAKSVKLTLDVVDNPKSVEYALRNETDGVWVDAKGKASPTAVWRTAGQWGVVKVKGLAPGTTYSFRVTARNSELIETPPSDALMVTTTAG